MAVRVTQELRKLPRVEFRGRVEIDLTAPPSKLTGQARPQARLEINPVNLSEGGICVRLEQALDIHSRVTLRLFAQPRKRPMECLGRVAWVVQRLDLRDAPPFLYDVGLEFVDPSPRLRQLVSGLGTAAKPSEGRQSRRLIQSATIRERSYIPRLQQESSAGNRWHLVIMVDGAPCFSRRYATEREALHAWEQFKRQRPT